MSVASKTKTKMYTTVLLGFVAVLSASPTWATTTPEVSSFATVDYPVVSTQGTQDLSVLRTKLKERFSGVAQEVRSLIDGTTTPAQSFHGSATERTIDVSQGIGVKPVNLSQDFFIDIENDPYRAYINRLAAYGVLSSSQKFFPQNYFRVDDFLGLLQKLYSKKFGQTLPQTVLSLTTANGIMTKWQLHQILSSLPNLVRVDIDGNPYDKLIRSEGAYYLVRMFDLPNLEIGSDTVSVSPDNYFSDIISHPFASAINTLASLGIVSTQTSRFYPDNYLRHYDFTTIFVNSLLIARGQSLSLLPSSSSSFADVESSATYLPQLIYAANRGLIDYIITSKRGQLYFEPNSFMTKHEVYQILGKTLNIQFTYDADQADTEKMTRGELAELLVHYFGLSFRSDDTNVRNSFEKDSFVEKDNDLTLLKKLKVLLSML